MINKKYYICISPFFPSPGNWRGAYVLDQVKAIQRNSEYEVVVFRPQASHFDENEYEIDGVKVYRFKIKSTPSFMFNGFYNKHNGKAFLQAIREVYGNDTEEFMNRVAFIHCHTGAYATYGLTLKSVAPQAKVFVQHHDLDPFQVRNGVLARWKPNAMYRAKNSIRLFNEVDLHICISTPCKDNLLAFPQHRSAEVYQSYIDALEPVKSCNSINPKNVFVLYNGVDTGIFKPKNIELRGESPENRIFRIGCIANFQELKDHISLVKAFEIMHKKGYDNIVLSLLGTGETRPMCKQYLQEHDLLNYVEWPKEVTHDKLPEYYHSLDLFVLPSYFEGFGCVYLEAAACGVPFICCKQQGASEYIPKEDSIRWLVEPHSPEQIANCIEMYYNSGNLQVLKYSLDIDNLINDFIKYIQQL